MFVADRPAPNGIAESALAVEQMRTICPQIESYNPICGYTPGGHTPLLPLLRSRQQAAILTAVLGEPEAESPLAALAERLGIPYPSVHREIDRAERVGLVKSRKLGNVRLVKANRASPYFAGLSDVLTKAFGPPTVIGQALAPLDGIDEAFIYGSWADRFEGNEGERPVGDIDLLVLGEPDRDALFHALASASARLGREVQVTIRPPSWLDEGSGTFHRTITSRPLVPVALRHDDPQP